MRHLSEIGDGEGVRLVAYDGDIEKQERSACQGFSLLFD